MFLYSATNDLNVGVSKNSLSYDSGFVPSFMLVLRLDSGLLYPVLL